MTKVFITKYALTQGIIEKTGEIKNGRFYPDGYWTGYNIREFSRSQKDAIKNAEKRRLQKIQSLEKQIEKLKNLKF